jgi:hypothetical protein
MAWLPFDLGYSKKAKMSFDSVKSVIKNNNKT